MTQTLINLKCYSMRTHSWSKLSSKAKLKRILKEGHSYKEGRTGSKNQM